MTTIRLTKTGPTTWVHGDFVIERREWILPHRSTSYRITRNGKAVDDCETLREVRQVIDMVLEDEADRYTGMSLAEGPTHVTRDPDFN